MKDFLIKDKKKANDEVKSFNNWQGAANIMYDIEDGEIWTDVFADDNSFKSYHSDTIICIVSKDNFQGRNGKTSLEKVLKYIPKAIETWESDKREEEEYWKALREER
jgi:hypothetical protein